MIMHYKYINFNTLIMHKHRHRSITIHQTKKNLVLERTWYNWFKNHSFFSAVCNILSTEGISIVVDFTYKEWKDGLELIKLNRLPYVRVDLSVNPFLRSLSEFLLHKGATDVVLVFENEQYSQEALHNIVQGFPFRTIIINANNKRNDFIKRIQSLRPNPSYLALLASATKMNIIFKKVINVLFD